MRHVIPKVSVIIPVYNVEAYLRQCLDSVVNPMTTHGNIFQRWRGWAWDKIFRRDFILSQKLEFQNLPVSNDLFFTYSALALSSKTIAVAKGYVLHRKRAGSVETTRDRSPLAPLEAVKVLYAKIGIIDGFARWVPEFLFWHINRLKTVDASDLLYRETKGFGEALGIRATAKWRLEEVKRIVKKCLRKVVRK